MESMIQGQFLFLGTGSSIGIPVIGCQCSVCLSENPLNKRLRPSGLITVGNKNILIDSGPDFRQQALKYKIHHLDGVLYTHTHFDHIAGLDELRIYYIQNQIKLPALVSKESMRDIETRYHYLFRKYDSQKMNLTAQLDFRILESERGCLVFEGLPFSYLSYWQGDMKITGYRIGNFAYISDLKDYKEEIFEDLVGLKYLVVSALRESPSAIHLTIDEAVSFAQKVNAEHTYFTHISHEVDHEKVNAQLPAGIYLGYDGFNLNFMFNKNYE